VLLGFALVRSSPNSTFPFHKGAMLAGGDEFSMKSGQNLLSSRHVLLFSANLERKV
jgi:hypothetical protein